MLAFIISLQDDESRRATQVLLDSIKKTKSEIIPVIFPAITHLQVEEELSKRNLEWSYPISIPRQEYGMILTPYPTKVHEKRVACSLSHLTLWETIANLNPNETYMILEQDAVFTRQFPEDFYDDMPLEYICSLNSPIGATRKANLYDKMLKESFEKIKKEWEDIQINEIKEGFELLEEDYLEVDSSVDVPWIDDISIPQGLPGNSAYVITPLAALKLIQKTHEIGLWPNDALICKQFFDDMINCAYPYYTKVQGNKSTTST